MDKKEWLKKNNATLVHECEHSEVYLCSREIGARRKVYMLEIPKERGRR